MWLMMDSEGCKTRFSARVHTTQEIDERQRDEAPSNATLVREHLPAGATNKNTGASENYRETFVLVQSVPHREKDTLINPQQ